jgi:hypothetical protein
VRIDAALHVLAASRSIRRVSPQCAASTASAATSMPCAWEVGTGLPPQPCRIGHSRTEASQPTTCQTQEPAGLPAPSNAAERQMRPLALGRKNSLFAGPLDGGRRAAIIYTLVGTAELNGWDP